MAAKEDWEGRYLAVCEKLIAGSKTAEKKIAAFYDYYLHGVGRPPKRSEHPDRLLNPSLNGTNEMLSELKACANHYLPGKAPETVEKKLQEFAETATGLVDVLESYKRLESLNLSYTVETDLVKYLTSHKNKPIKQETHEKIVAQYISKLKASFYSNSDAIYNHVTSIIEAPVTGHDFRETTDAILRSVTSVKNDTSLLVRGFEFEPEMKIRGGKLKQWNALAGFMKDHSDRANWSVRRCVQESFVAEDDGFSSWEVLNSYASDHRSLLPA